MAFENKETFNEVAALSLKNYGLENTDTASLITFSENATYMVSNKITGEKSGVLRVSRPGYHTLDEINSEMLWLKQINDYTPLQVARAIKGLDGKRVQQIAGPDGNTYICVMTEFLTGKNPDESNIDELTEQFESLGETTAYLHRQTEIWNGAEELDRITWDYDTIIGEKAVWGDWRDFPGITAEQEKVLAEASEIIKTRLEKYPKTEENFGLIHADLRLANILIDEGQVKVIDFDDCGFGYHLHDLAGAISFIEEKDYIPDLVNAWLRGYKKVLPITDTDFEEIDTFITMRRLQFTAWLASHQESDPAKQYTAGWMDGTMYLAERYIKIFG